MAFVPSLLTAAGGAAKAGATAAAADPALAGVGKIASADPTAQFNVGRGFQQAPQTGFSGVLQKVQQTNQVGSALAPKQQAMTPLTPAGFNPAPPSGLAQFLQQLQQAQAPAPTQLNPLFPQGRN